MTKEVIGIAGCGAMGEPMIQRLLTAGFEVWAHDVRPLAEFGAIAEHMLEDAAEFARRCNVVISVVRDADQTRSLLFSEAQGIVRGANPPEILVISSTVSARFVRQLLTELPAQTSLVDAAMSGAPYRAREGTLSFMLGGPDAVVDRLMPILKVMGSRLY
ncbi:MAG: NAD(P)-binding domain-containing protein, partial [Pseudomonadota bacterium]|nr:NAD(P)-binding domain-containing protein [Pseudomonadota bacterium]